MSLAPLYLLGDCEIIMQIGTARYGIRNQQGEFCQHGARFYVFAGLYSGPALPQQYRPAGITIHNKCLQRGLVVEEKFQRVANYAQGVNKEIEMISHSCGLKHARELRREHVRLVQTAGQSMAMNMLYPYPAEKGKLV